MIDKETAMQMRNAISILNALSEALYGHHKTVKAIRAALKTLQILPREDRIYKGIIEPLSKADVHLDAAIGNLETAEIALSAYMRRSGE